MLETEGASGTKTWKRKMEWSVQGAANNTEGRNQGVKGQGDW